MWQLLVNRITKEWVGGPFAPSPPFFPLCCLHACWTQTRTVTSALGQVWVYGATSHVGQPTWRREREIPFRLAEATVI